LTGKPREKIAKAFSTSLDEAVRFREDAKRSGKTFVLTNGCFDLLHYGHVSSLTEASKLGDYLWVAMNSDSSTRNLKGNDRPIIPEEERACLLASLTCVSGVTLFENRRLVKEILALQPDIYVKSGDYTEDSIDPEEKDALRLVQASIKFVPFVQGSSTTSLLKRIQSLPTLT
jgi:D-glycero-beta-D-manno-heptose 1-phosphate adenylyltransferase